MANIALDRGQAVGNDYYTLQTEQQQRDECLSDQGHIPDRDSESDINIAVSINPDGISAVEWVTTPRAPGAQPLSTHKKVESTTVDGREAVRLAWEQTAETSDYLISANGRMYWISPPLSSLPSDLPERWIDEIAQSFRAVTPQPMASPAPTQPPREAARELGEALAIAFAATDVDAIAGLITPRCWLNVGSTVPSGGQGRAVVDFLADLRTEFEGGRLKVNVDPAAQVETNQSGPDGYFVRSDWDEAGRMTRIDLHLGPFEGGWYWHLAMHHHQGGASYSCLWAGTVTSC